MASADLLHYAYVCFSVSEDPTADKTTLQLRMLNLGKGPAVHSPRAQVDKHLYHDNMLETLLKQENLDFIEDEVVENVSKKTSRRYI